MRSQNKNIREKVESALNEVRDILRADGGDVELVEVTDGGVVKVRLVGACGHCPFAAYTLKMRVEKHSGQEQRFKRIGLSALGRILHVVYTVRRTKDGKETIRIIGARQASRKERQAYARP